MLSDRCPVCLSCAVCPVCNVGVLWPNGWTDQDEFKLGMQVGLVPGHIVLDGNLAPSHKKGEQPHPNILPMSVVAKRLKKLRCHLIWR